MHLFLSAFRSWWLLITPPLRHHHSSLMYLFAFLYKDSILVLDQSLNSTELVIIVYLNALPFGLRSDFDI